jgi:O-antigen ligase
MDFQIMGIAVSLILTAVGLLVFIIAGDISPYWNKFANSQAGGQMFNLTGRGVIWDVAIEVWQQNPLFGYGPKLWDPEFRKSIGMSFAFSAHNQFMQTLSGAGIIGMLGLLAYLGIVLRYAVGLAHATKGLSLALGLFLVIRCMTETPLSTSTLFNGDLLTHLLVFGFLVRVRVRQQKEQDSLVVSVVGMPLPARST